MRSDAEESVDLSSIEKRDEFARSELLWDGKNALDQPRVLRAAQSGETNPRMHGGQPGVTCADAVLAINLKAIEKGADPRGIEIHRAQVGGCVIDFFLREGSRSRKVSRYAPALGHPSRLPVSFPRGRAWNSGPAPWSSTVM